jgi:hypothetical protein
MATDIKQHTLAMTNGSLTILRQIIPTPGWYEGQRLSVPVRAEEFLELPEVSALEVPPESDPVAQDNWAKVEVKVEVSEKVREALKVCVGFYLKKAHLRPSRHTSRLIRELGLSDE